MESRDPKDSSTQLSAVDEAQNSRLDKAFVYSVVALIVSVLGTLVAVADAYFSRDQARTLRSQQDIILEQRAASAWPLIEWRPSSEYTDDMIMIYFNVSNKGLGPAIVGDVTYQLNGFEISGTTFIDDTLRHLRPGMVLTQYQNATLDSTVVSPGETVRLLTLRIPRTPAVNAEFTSYNKFVEWIKQVVTPKFCYCSVYDRCWAFRGIPQPPRSRECESASAR